MSFSELFLENIIENVESTVFIDKEYKKILLTRLRLLQKHMEKEKEHS